MKRGRGRPPVYKNADQQPALVALRIPRALEARLRHESAESGRTLTDILLQALVMRWEEAQTTEEVSQLRQQLAQLQKQAKTQERQYARKHTRLMENFRYVHQKRKEIQRERDHLAEKLAGAEADVERMFERLAVFTAENPELAEENARRYANVRQEARRRRLEEMRDELDDITAGLTGRTHTSPVSVRELQIRFHPDKWSNGQTAEEALTELMKVLNR